MSTRITRRLKLSEAQNHRCAFCCVQMELYEQGPTFSPTFATVEHVIPLGEGGLNSLENMVATCNSCNNERGMTSLIFFLSKKNPGYERNPDDAAFISALYLKAKMAKKASVPHQKKLVERLRSMTSFLFSSGKNIS